MFAQRARFARNEPGTSDDTRTASRIEPALHFRAPWPGASDDIPAASRIEPVTPDLLVRSANDDADTLERAGPRRATQMSTRRCVIVLMTAASLCGSHRDGQVRNAPVSKQCPDRRSRTHHTIEHSSYDRALPMRLSAPCEGSFCHVDERLDATCVLSSAPREGSFCQKGSRLASTSDFKTRTEKRKGGSSARKDPDS